MRECVCMSMIFLVLSYLSPSPQYKKFFEFVICIFVCIIILKPITSDYKEYLEFDDVVNKIRELSYENETNLFETFLDEKE